MSDQRLHNLLNNNHQFVVNRLPKASFKTTRVRLPGFSFGNIELPVINQTLYIPGMKFIPDPVVVTAIVDERMDNYFEALKWMIDCRYYEEKELVTEVLQDFTINILDNHGNPATSFRYGGGFIQSIDGLDLTSTVSTTEDVTVTMTLYYQKIEIDQYNGENPEEVLKIVV